MRRLNYTLTNEILYYQNIYGNKVRSSRAILDALQPDVLRAFNYYSNNFTNIHINPTPNLNLTDVQSSELENCYNNSTSALNNLKAIIRNQQTGFYRHTCPYCLISNPSTFDHYIPKGEAPIYSVFAKNLIPCCYDCNQIKSTQWRANNHRTIVHFYFDDVNTSTFLNCTLVNHQTIPRITFSLNLNNVSNQNRQLIDGHFTQLNLITRYNLVVSNLVYELAALCQSHQNSLPVLDISQILSDYGNNLINVSRNYWKAIAIIQVARDIQFINNLLNLPL